MSEKTVKSYFLKTKREVTRVNIVKKKKKKRHTNFLDIAESYEILT